MGTVWEAQHATIQRRFALKFLLPELALKEDMRHRFEREARSAGAIESEHVAAVLDHGVTGAGEPFIVMEYLDGEDLASILERERQLATFRAAQLVAQAAHGVAKAHRRGVIHRDVKPQNLFVVRREDGTELCKVLDFGVALDTARRSGVSTKSGHLIGTLDYMSPEQLRGAPNVDARSDVYSLGCVLYECLAARRPYEATWPHVLMQRILETDAPRLQERRTGLPPGLPEVVERAMQKVPERRFQSMDEFAAALAPFAGRSLIVDTRIGDCNTVPSMPSSSMQRESHIPPPPVAESAESRTGASPSLPPKAGSEAAARRGGVRSLRTRLKIASVGVVAVVGALVATRMTRSREGPVPQAPDVRRARPSDPVTGAGALASENRAPSMAASFEGVRPTIPVGVASVALPAGASAVPPPSQRATAANNQTHASQPPRPPTRRELQGATNSSAEAPVPRPSRKTPSFDLTTDPYSE
jgi:serine/threonine-protein kinase